MLCPRAQPSRHQGALLSPHSPPPRPPRQQSLRARWALQGELFCVNKMTTRLFQKEALTLRPPVEEPPPPFTRPCLQESVSKENESQADLEKLKGVGLEEKDNQLHLYSVFSPYKACSHTFSHHYKHWGLSWTHGWAALPTLGAAPIQRPRALAWGGR